MLYQESVCVDHILEALLGFNTGGHEDAAIQIK